MAVTRWSDTMGLEDPRSNRNGNVIAQVVLEQLGVPADGPSAAVGVVAVGQADGRAVAGDVAGIAFNAQAVAIAAQIAAAEASGRASAPASAWPAGRRPSDRPAGGPVRELHRATGAGGSRGTMLRRAGSAGMPALCGWVLRDLGRGHLPGQPGQS